MKTKKILMVANALGDSVSLKSLALVLRAADVEIIPQGNKRSSNKAFDDAIKEAGTYKIHRSPDMDDVSRVMMAKEKARKPWISDRFVGNRKKKF